MRRVVNNRPICFGALSLALGLFLTGWFINFYYLRVIFIALSLILAGVFLIIKKEKLIYLPIFFALGVFLLSGVNDVYCAKIIEKKNVEMTGTISSEIVERDNYYYFKLENITIDGESVKNDATVYTYYLIDERAGDKIKITGDVETRNIDFRNFSVYPLTNSVYYNIYADTVEYEGEGKLKVSSNINVTLKRALYQNADVDASDTLMALILGDKYSLSSDYKENIQDAGLMHIFAVSGLHIGMFLGIMLAITKRLKIKGIAKFLIIEIPLVLYAWLCGFPASVVRALIMSSVFLLAKMSGRQIDSLNAVAFSAIIVMILMPTSVYSAGFLMSFSAVIGLIVLAEPISQKLKLIPKRVNGIISSSFAVNIMLFPLLAGFFEEIQTLFVISNALLLPILPFIYGILLLMCIIVLIIPSSAPMLIATNIITWPIKAVATLIGELAISSISVSGFGIFALIYYGVIFINSRYVFLPKFKKLSLTLIYSTAVLAIIPIFSLL